jgi:hypothetical protein
VVPGYSATDVAAAAIISFGVGIAVGAIIHGTCCGWGWGGWGTNWHGNTIIYNRNVYVGNAYWRSGYNGGYRPGYPAYRPGYPGYVRPPAAPGTRPPYPPVRPPTYNGPRPTPYPTGQGTNARPVNPTYRPNTTTAQPRPAQPVPKTNVSTPWPQPSTSEFRGYQRPQTSGSPTTQPARSNAFSPSAGARAQSGRGNQSLRANGGGRVASNR